MRNFTEEELQQAIVDAFDMGALHGVSWGREEYFPPIQKRRKMAAAVCGNILLRVIRNQDAKQS